MAIDGRSEVPIRAQTPTMERHNARPPALVWPPLLEVPPEHVTLVYLDLNHWISLAQASVGHPKGRAFAHVLEACRAARKSGSATFVLSGTHYAEMLKIKDPSQRRTLADVMEDLTDFSAIVSRVVVMELELAAVLDQIAKPAHPLRSIPLVGRGVRHAFGIKTGLRIMGPAGDETELIRDRMGAHTFAEFVAQADLLLERSVLRGPGDSEVEAVRALGWNPEAITQIAERRANEERGQSRRLESGGWRRSRLRDVVSARELLIEFQDTLPRALADRGLVPDDLMSDTESGRAFVRAMPSTEVSIEIKSAWHRNRDKPWTANDIHDIDGLSLAVPYCDIVVIDKACHHVLAAAELGTRMHTALLRRLDDLPSVLVQWKPRRAPRI